MNHATNSTRASILVVDDDIDTCHNLSDILTDLGYWVETASSGDAALRLIRQKPYDIVLLDFKMPGMDGVTLYRAIKEVRADTVAVLVTAYAGEDTAAAARAAGAWKVLSKPVDLPNLFQILNAALDQPLIMIVDDDHALCSSLWDVLRERNYRVCMAHDERQAAGRLMERQFQVVLIDMKLSIDGGGEKVFALVRRCNPNARVILTTGFRRETAKPVEQLVAEGADAVSYKPFDFNELFATLQRLALKPDVAPQETCSGALPA